ncbi:MAG: response regulator [Desulfobacterales bacterium]|nr:response regulator [Desulfobacterales bacterium]
MKNRLTFKNTLIFKFVIVALVPFIAIGYIVLRIHSRDMTGEISMKNLLLARSLAGEVEIFLDRPLSLLRQIEDVVEKQALISEEQTNAYLDTVTENHNFFNMVQILDHNGVVRHVSPFSNDHMEINMSGQPFFKSAVKSRAPYWSPTFISTQTGKPTLTLSIYSENRIIVGYLNLEILNSITDRIKIGSYGYAAIVDLEGTVIAHPNRTFVYERMNMKNLDPFPKGEKRREKTFRYTFMGTEKLGSICVVPQTEWVITVIQPVKEAFAPVERIKRTFMAGAVFSILTAIFMALISLKNTLEPLSRLITDTKRIAQGDYSFSSQARGYPEIDELAEHFRIMAEAVKERENALVKKEETLVRQNEYMRALHETSVSLVSHLDIAELLQAIVNRAASLAKASDSFIHLYDPEKKELEIKVGAGSLAERVGYRVKPGQGLVGKVWQTGRFILVDDYQKWPGRIQNLIFDNIRAMVGIPLKSGSHIQGVIGLAHTEEGKQIGHDEVAILEEFARLASIALDNARLYTRVQEELAERKRLEKERETIEARLRQFHKMQAISTLAGGIAHDFNNILFPIIGYAEMAIDDVPEKNLARDKLERILKLAFRARDIVQQILFFSRKSNEKERKPVKIQHIIKEALILSGSAFPASIEIKQHIDNCGIVSANPAQIHQVIMNVCVNACYAMRKKGGVLHVSLNEIELGPDESALYPDTASGSYVRLSIKDTGHGMADEIRERIFEPYFTTKKTGEGPGLGLSIVHGIVKNHDGTICVSSKPGKGTVFNIILPLIKNQESETGNQSLHDSLPKRNARIMLVDDEEQIVGMVKQLLERMGYNVTGITDSIEALKVFAAFSEKFDLVITDTTMPGMSGVELSKELLRIRPGIPIIICTGYSEEISEEKAKAIGIRAFVMKPVFKSDLAAVIQKMLNQ